MTKKVIFRADGDSKTGLGHLYRLFSLVEIVKESLEFIFLSHNDSSSCNMIPIPYNKGIIPEYINIENEPEWLAVNFDSSEYIIVADGYQFNSEYQRKVKKQGFTLIYIDDLASEYMFADLVINHSPNINRSSYRKETYTKFALGTKYALLRPLFLEKAEENRAIAKVDTAFVCFGGADPYDLSFKAVNALYNSAKFDSIHVVLGGAYSHKKIYGFKEKYSKSICIHQNLSEQNLVSVMEESNFAIAPSSTILYELSCIKMPILSGFYVDNQELIYNGFLDSNAIYGGGNMKNYEVLDFEKAIDTILKEKNFINQIEAQKKLFDGKIKDRNLNLIKELC